MKHNETTEAILSARFGKDSLIALATAVDGVPHARTVDAVYIGGAFLVNALYVAIGEAAVLLTLGALLYRTMAKRNLHTRLFG